MEKRIQLECRGAEPEKITELNLDNCRATQIEGLTANYINLKKLSLINVGLTTLKGLPSLPALQKLELSDNRISGGLNLLAGCPQLTHLNLSGNKIKTIETLEALRELPNLRSLDLFNCEVTSGETYREEVFSTLPKLVYLDGFDIQDMEDEEESEGEDEEDDDDEDGLAEGPLADGSDEDDSDLDGLDDSEDEEGEDSDVEEAPAPAVDGDSEEAGDEFGEEDDEEGDEEDGGDESDEDEEEVGLDYLNREDLEDGSSGEDFAPGDQDPEDDLDSEEDVEEAPAQGVKRKREEDEEEA